MIKLKDLLTETKLNEGSDTFVNILTKFGFTKGARDWGGHQFFVHKSKGLYATYNPNGRSLVIEPKRGGKPVFDTDRSNFSIKALLNYLQSPSNKFVSTEGGKGSGRPRMATPATGKDNKRPTKNPFPKESPAYKTWKKKHGKKNEGKLTEKEFVPTITIDFTRENRGKGRTEVKKFKTIPDAKKYTRQMNKKYKLKRQKGFWGNPVTGIELSQNFS